MARFAVVLPAAGRSTRFGGGEKKPFVDLAGRAVWLRSAELFVNRADVCGVWVVIAPEDRGVFELRYSAHLALLGVQVVDGGAERFESVARALEVLPDEADHVAIHDAVRPCTPTSVIDAVFRAAEEQGAALAAVPVTDTIKEVNTEQRVVATRSRDHLWLAQTPQAARRDWLIDAYARRSELGTAITDDAQLLEATGRSVVVVAGSALNRKITTPDDLRWAAALLASPPDPTPAAPPARHPFQDDWDR